MTDTAAWTALILSALVVIRVLFLSPPSASSPVPALVPVALPIGAVRKYEQELGAALAAHALEGLVEQATWIARDQGQSLRLDGQALGYLYYYAHSLADLGVPPQVVRKILSDVLHGRSCRL